MERIADGVWAYVQPDGGWMINNMGVVAGDGGLTSVDVTSTEARTRDYLTAIDDLGQGPVRRVILTHSHPDHCNGLSLLPDAEIVAHRSVVADLQQTHGVASHIFTPFRMGDVAPRIPTVVFDESLTLDPGSRRIELRHPRPRAHTGGDLFVWLPAERVLFAGDLVFNGGTPFALFGSIEGWLRALESMAALEPLTVVPGHGPVGGIGLLEPVADYLRYVQSAALDARERGVSALDAAKALDLGPFGDLPERERLVGNLHRAIAELAGTEPDIEIVWEDMLAFNGGRPLDCHA